MRNIYLYAISVLALTACQTQHYYYIPPSHQVPLFKEKHEFAATGSAGFTRSSNCKDIKAAFSITDHVAVMGSWMNWKNNKERTVNGERCDWWNGDYYDGAIGFYRDEKKWGRFDVFLGLGSANQQHHFTETIDDGLVLFFPVFHLEQRGDASINYKKIFVQSSYGYSIKDAVDIIVSVKASDLYMDQVKHNVDRNYFAWREMESLKSQKNYLLFEPCLTLRAGWKYLKFQMQYGYTAFLSGGMPYDSYHFNMGLQLSVCERFWRKESKAGAIK